ncbi:MAG: putative sigma-54 modulation protein [Planctomycetota bacterium]|jgi:putative sigma-54 modulation protein
MKLELRAKGIRVTEKLQAHIDRHLRTAMGRFGDQVRRVQISLKDINGPKGGEDIRCEITAQMAHSGAIVIHETNTNPFAAVARASSRAGHTLSRQLDRMKARRKGR